MKKTKTPSRKGVIDIGIPTGRYRPRSEWERMAMKIGRLRTLSLRDKDKAQAQKVRLMKEVNVELHKIVEGTSRRTPKKRQEYLKAVVQIFAACRIASFEEDKIFEELYRKACKINGRLNGSAK